MAKKVFVVSESDAGQRLDKLLVKFTESMGRKAARGLFEEGRVRVGRRRAQKGDVAACGDEVTVDLPEGDGPSAVPEPSAKLVVRLETEQLVVVEKPAGQATAPLRMGETGTLANALVGHYPEMAAIGRSPREPGLIHRLDNDTSGLLVAARNEAAFGVLCEGLSQGNLKKGYLLICAAEGLASTGTVEIPIAHHPKDKRRMYPCVHPRDVARYRPRPASTQYRVLRTAGQWALVEARAAAAVRHQIRAHMAAIGHPLANDTLYGGPEVLGLYRHALHASFIDWVGGAGASIVPPFSVASPLPYELEALLK